MNSSIALVFVPNKNTTLVVSRIAELAAFAYDVYDCRASVPVEKYPFFFFVSPTYGDDELHPDMESFLQTLTIKDREFALCELGNYYGYDRLDFGAARTMRGQLERLGWKERMASASVDSLPLINWPVLENWIRACNEELLGKRRANSR